MNCKPGDLAIIVSHGDAFVYSETTGAGYPVYRVGTIVRVTSFKWTPEHGVEWYIEEPLKYEVSWSNGYAFGNIYRVPDDWLRPLEGDALMSCLEHETVTSS